MRKASSEYYSETDNDPQLVDIWAELEATYHDKAPRLTPLGSFKELQDWSTETTRI